MTLLLSYCIYSTGLFLKVTFLPHRNELSFFLLLRNLTWILTFARITALSQTSPSFLRLLNGLFLYSSSLILNSQVFSLLVNQDSGLIIPLKLSYSLFFLTSTQLLINLNLLCWLSMMSLPPLTW